MLVGRSLEFCTPVVLTDGERIHEIAEMANDRKVLRRCAPKTARAWVFMKPASGMRGSFRITTNHFEKWAEGEQFEKFLGLYARLFD